MPRRSGRRRYPRDGVVRPSRFVRRFARLATDIVVRQPALWRLFRRPLRSVFDGLAPIWDDLSGPLDLAPLEAALAQLQPPPTRTLDLGTGTGAGAVALAARFPHALVVGVDLSPEMVALARQKLPADLAHRVTFEVADASSLPFADGAFDLVALVNAIPFFDELARVTAAGGSAVFCFSRGAQTPIYVPPETIETRLGARGFSEHRIFQAGEGVALLSSRPRTP